MMTYSQAKPFLVIMLVSVACFGFISGLQADNPAEHKLNTSNLTVDSMSELKHESNTTPTPRQDATQGLNSWVEEHVPGTRVPAVESVVNASIVSVYNGAMTLFGVVANTGITAGSAIPDWAPKTLLAQVAGGFAVLTNLGFVGYYVYQLRGVMQS